ncbi:helix-turn-helix domain-containing protein [Actinoallomurus rhizosphaericola]|uniref:helix-turn-helix domain-containing protein n=1 Tax=Actinoallomurus rhizosphaericola TaxID=2952536 RepID=UPI002092921C|nr:helix-turn-helix transcriptional regulator [Actinoallomurus rhizosphaericola]MCO5996526.1 helix-turn-helix domain-containing protein [Actinoallomurus rhizosphaericola]
MTEPHSPTVRGRKLASELRRLRKDVDLAVEEAAAQLGWSRFKVSRIEKAQTKPTVADLRAMLDLYGVDNANHAALIELHKNSWRRGWWTDYSDVFRGSYVALEDDAATIEEWSPQLIPGLLQTDDYARAVIRASLPGDEAVVQRRVQARSARRTLLGRTDRIAPTFIAIIDESALRRPIGGPEVMRSQLRALLDAARRPNVSLRVLPYAAGAHPGLDGPFIILSFPEQLAPDVAYVETKGGDIYAESAADVRRFRVDFGNISAAALTPEESMEFIAAVIKE